MKIKVESSKLTDAPYSKAMASAFVLEDDGALNQLKLELENALPGSYLISGYRGSGKTSFINRIKEKVTGFMIVDLNIPQKEEYPKIIKKIIRQLHLTYLSYESGAKEKISEEFKAEFELLYDRTFNDVVHSQLASLKKEKKSESKFQFDFKKIFPYLIAIMSATGISFFTGSVWLSYLICAAAIAWASVADFSQTLTRTVTDGQSAEVSRKSLYDDEIAEYHLFSILQTLKESGFKILIVFDELDKLQDDDKIKEVINDLKPLLLSGYASCLVVAGQSLFYELEKSTYLDDLVISTLFSKSVHVAFLKNAAIKKYCLGLISDEADKSILLVNDFFDSLILQSGRNPRKLVNLIRSAITWEPALATIVIDESRSDNLRWKSRILQAVSYAIDNKMAGQSKNTVQLDFFTSQSFIWLGKMLQYTSIPFLQADIFKPEDYDARYPANYIKELIIIWHSLVDQLSEDKLIKITESSDPEADNDSYSWIIIEEIDVDVRLKEELEVPKPVKPKKRTSTKITPEEETVLSEDRMKQSRFLVDFADLEAYINQLYIEIVPAAKNSPIGFKKLIDGLLETGVLTKGWRSMPTVTKLNETRNKISHGKAIGINDLDEVRTSAANMAQIRAEINEAFVYFVTKNYLQEASVEKSTRGGFDFIATANTYSIAFEVKSAQTSKLDNSVFSELLDKYSNYVVSNNLSLHYTLFFFQSPGRKSLDDFFMNFEAFIENVMPGHKKDIHLFYITDANERSIREQIENDLTTVVRAIGKETMP